MKQEGGVHQMPRRGEGTPGAPSSCCLAVRHRSNAGKPVIGSREGRKVFLNFKVLQKFIQNLLIMLLNVKLDRILHLFALVFASPECTLNLIVFTLTCSFCVTSKPEK